MRSASCSRAFQIDRTEDDYYASVEGKTSALFATAARIGALVAGHDRDLVDAATTYGLRLGTAFQIVDDILDLTASEAELGKPTGHDLFEGVYTLPVLMTLSHDSVASGELRDLLGRPVEGIELEKALGIVRSNGGIPGAAAAARAQVVAAVGELDAFPATPAIDAMRAGAQHLVSSLPG